MSSTCSETEGSSSGRRFYVGYGIVCFTCKVISSFIGRRDPNSFLDLTVTLGCFLVPGYSSPGTRCLREWAVQWSQWEHGTQKNTSCLTRTPIAVN